MPSSESSYRAVVTTKKDDSGTTTTTVRVPEEGVGETLAELHAHRNCLRTQLDETNQVITQKKVEKQEEKNEASTRNYKRPSWAQAEWLTVRCPGFREKKQLDMILTDDWCALQEAACALFDVDSKQYILTFVSTIPLTKKVRNEDTNTRVGDFSVWDGELFLRKRPPPTTAAASSHDVEKEVSSSDSDSS
jgi:hypothetical protein